MDKKLLVSIIAVIVALLSFQFRYEVIPLGKVAAYRLDKWTGEIVLIAGQEAYPVKEG